MNYPDDECSHCGALAFLWLDEFAVDEDSEEAKPHPDHCPRCGALVDDEGKVWGP